MSVQKLARASYGHAISTVFGPKPSKTVLSDYDEDDDPILREICYLDYRYLRLIFHPLNDKFLLCTNWTDTTWTSVKAMQTGLDNEERYRREQVFDRNQIDIKEKSIPQLLVDEVGVQRCMCYHHLANLSRLFIHFTSSKSQV